MVRLRLWGGVLAIGRLRRTITVLATVMMTCVWLLGNTGCSTHRTAAQWQLARAAVAMGLALANDGCPYVFGGTGPCSAGYDCSGLVYKIYQDLGKAIPRTSQDQSGHLTSDSGKVGDLVFFPGASPPNDHVGLVVSMKKHLMIDAYGVGRVVRVEHFGEPGVAPGLENPTGYVDPTQ